MRFGYKFHKFVFQVSSKKESNKGYINIQSFFPPIGKSFKQQNNEWEKKYITVLFFIFNFSGCKLSHFVKKKENI